MIQEHAVNKHRGTIGGSISSWNEWNLCDTHCYYIYIQEHVFVKDKV